MLIDDPILAHPTREKLLEHIRSYPGVNFTELLNLFSLSEGTLRYHLAFLLKGNRIRTCLEQGRRCYFPGRYRPSEIGWEIDMERIHLDPPKRNVLSIIEENPMINQKDLSKISGLNRFKLRARLKDLMELGFIRKKRDGKEVHYIPTNRMEIRREVLRALASDLLRKEISERTYLKARKILDEELF